MEIKYLWFSKNVWIFQPSIYSFILAFKNYKVLNCRIHGPWTWINFFFIFILLIRSYLTIGLVTKKWNIAGEYSPFWRVGDWFWSNAAVGGKVALPLACPKDCRYKLVPFRLGKPPEVGVTVKGCWGFEEVKTEVKVVEFEFCEAAAWSKEANCSGLYSVFKGLLE